MISKYILAILGVLFGAQPVFACGEIVPNKEVTLIVKRLAYPDFPKAADIFAAIRIESSFNPNAINRSHSGTQDSIGLMQVNMGPIDQRLNVAMGVSLLREYYTITHSRKGAIEAYNIGIGNYLKGKMKISAAEYYSKYHLQRRVYASYAKTGKLHYLGKSLGCGHLTSDPSEAVSGYTPSGIQSYNWETSIHHYTGGGIQSNGEQSTSQVRSHLDIGGSSYDVLLRGDLRPSYTLSSGSGPMASSVSLATRP